MDRDYEDVLRREFETGEDSFLIQLRPALYWNREAFTRLILAMEACCRDTERKKSLERWVAWGFWYFSWFVKDWATHPNFPKDEPAEYYAKAFERLDDLAYWYFFGESPYLPGTGFEPL